MATQGMRLLQGHNLLGSRLIQMSARSVRVPHQVSWATPICGRHRAAACDADPGAKGDNGSRTICSISNWELACGGARTALFNWLYAKNTGGQFILRVEDTDAARSTRESEAAMVRDLKWLGLDWDEGPDVGGSCGPYRQSERGHIYMSYVDKLVAAGKAYPCFCTDEELDAMRAEAEAKKLPPVYMGRWASASQQEVDEMKAKGVPFCYRFRVPPGRDITIDDVIRGKVTWNTDTLGDFVIMRSNGLPVYNFCVAIDDALMGITHVLRAEEHLPNTLRQMLIYQAFDFPPPTFGHVSLILAPDKSKLSKRHGATSVGEFREQGFLPAAMNNFLSLLGWNDGTEQEIFSIQELQSKFDLGRITKSAAVFDKVKLSWMNGQHLRSLPEEELKQLLAQRLADAGLVDSASSRFASIAADIMKGSVELVTDADGGLLQVLSYPLEETVQSEEFAFVRDDNFKEFADALLAGYDSGELVKAAEGGHDTYKKFINGIGKAQKRKGKRLFMPLRVALTGRMQGPDVGEVLSLLLAEQGNVVDRSKYVDLPSRIERLRKHVATL